MAMATSLKAQKAYPASLYAWWNPPPKLMILLGCIVAAASLAAFIVPPVIILCWFISCCATSGGICCPNILSMLLSSDICAIYSVLCISFSCEREACLGFTIWFCVMHPSYMR